MLYLTELSRLVQRNITWATLLSLLCIFFLRFPRTSLTINSQTYNSCCRCCLTTGRGRKGNLPSQFKQQQHNISLHKTYFTCQLLSSSYCRVITRTGRITRPVKTYTNFCYWCVVSVWWLNDSHIYFRNKLAECKFTVNAINFTCI